MKILGIETSCDETAIAVLKISPRRIRRAHRGEFIEPQARGEEITVLSSVISSQVKLHAKYGGVVPNLAAREHVKNIEHVFKLALKTAKTKIKDIDLIAVTRGPGLAPALLVGIAFAKALAWKYDKPLVGVSHLEGHIYSNWLNPDFKPKTIRFPVLNLIVSGGHTELVLMSGHGKYKVIGETLDDAVGEAFDKVARLLGLGYPGGPVVAQRATKFKVESSKLKVVEEFPKPMEKSKNYNFSYSGLKTSVLYKIRDLEKAGIKLTDNIKNEICYEFQKAAVDVLIKKTTRAAKEYEVKSIFLSGGVSANKYLRTELAKATKELKVNYSQPELEYTGDNAVMIALAGYFSSKNKKPRKQSWKLVKMDANLGF